MRISVLLETEFATAETKKIEKNFQLVSGDESGATENNRVRRSASGN
jgi:hypothetical protein